MSGTLYVIGTPIGNLDDITIRQLETLKNVDFICAEDTRVTLKLLTRFEIKKQLISYHEHSLRMDHPFAGGSFLWLVVFGLSFNAKHPVYGYA